MDHDALSPAALRERWDRPVRSIAARYVGYDLDDLVAAGHEGVLHARRRYVESAEPPKTPFEQAVWGYIRNFVDRAASMQRPRLRRPRIDATRLDASLEQMEMLVSNPLGHDYLGGALDLINQIASAALIEVSVDPDLFAKLEPTPEDLVEDERARDQVGAAIGFLDDPERGVVLDRYHDDLTFDEIAAKRGFGEKWARELHQRALRKLRETLVEQKSGQRKVR